MSYVFKFVINVFTVVIFSFLILFSVRRIIFAIVAIISRLNKTSQCPSLYQPTVTILVPCHNEESVIANCLKSLTQLTYPKQNIEIVVCDDGSTDNTLNIARTFEKKFDFIYTLSISLSIGKAAIMNLALQRFKKGEIIYTFDADSTPRPNCLTKAVRHFTSSLVGAVSGNQPVRNRYDNFISYYAFLDRLFSYWTAYANDKLFLGAGYLASNCGIRRNLLEKIGLFDESCLIEDASLELRIYESGSRIKYDHEAISEQEVPVTLKGYFYQRLGWVKGMNELGSKHYKEIFLNKKLNFKRKARTLLLLFFYWDRIFCALAALMTVAYLLFFSLSPLFYWVWIMFFGSLIFQTIAYLIAEKSDIRAYLRLPILAILFPFEIFVVVKAVAEDFLGKKRIRYKTLRKHEKINLRATKEH